MKKLIVPLILSLILSLSVSVSASAQVDLSSMSYDELVELKDQINLAIWNSDDWQQVYVPQGIWEIGKDIPAGHWTISPVDRAFTRIVYGSYVDSSGTDVSGEPYYSEFATNPSSVIYQKGSDQTSLSLILEDGHFLMITSGDVIFTPYSGKPSLGFKK